MKLRMQGSSLRMRLTRSEVTRLLEAGEVMETARFPGGATLTYRVRKHGEGALCAALAGSAISISVPAARIEDWAGSGEVGLYAEDGELRIAIEKDFRCLTRPSEDQDADAYPHPADGCSA